MPINKLIKFCTDSYNKGVKCKTCVSNCTGDCNICLQAIHNEQDSKRHYDCCNMIYCYTCSYINKYASEIYYALNALVSHSSTKNTEYNILSIGCGDCADLFGIQHFLNVNQREINISYTGVDINEKWKPIHEYIPQLFPDVNFNYKYQDAIDYVASLEDVPFNIVILEYVLNEIIKYTPDNIDDFINELSDKILDRLPSNSLVIFNDINHKMVRDYYPKIKLKIEQKNDIACLSLRFNEPFSHTYGGAKLQNDSLVFNTSITPFSEKNPCSSSIFIIHKK